jgi:hypothetical protein
MDENLIKLFNKLQDILQPGAGDSPRNVIGGWCRGPDARLENNSVASLIGNVTGDAFLRKFGPRDSVSSTSFPLHTFKNFGSIAKQGR